MADIKEELDILEKKNAHVMGERDGLNSKCRDMQFQMTQLQETITDKDEKIEHLQAQMEVLQSGKAFIKKSYDSLMAKFKKIEDENLLIPKKKSEEAKGEQESKPVENPASAAENELNAVLQD